MVTNPNKLKTQKSFSQKAYLSSYPYNLIQSGNLEKYCKILTEFKFIEAKINHPELGIQALTNDYDLINDIETNQEYDPHKVKALKLIQGTLKLSAHIISKDSKQLASQLQGRLLGNKIPEIQGLLAQVRQRQTGPWLRPLTPNLTPPGGHLLRTLNGHNDWVRAVAVTPNDKQVISGSSDNTLKVWNLETGEELFTLKGHNDWVNAIAVTPNGKQVISGSDDNTLKIWNLETGEELFTLNGHNASVRAVAVTPNDKQVISGSSDETLKVWNLETGEVVTTFTGEGSIYCCTVAPDGVTIVVGEVSGRLHFLRLEGIDG
jgi:WD40 repeat protein